MLIVMLGLLACTNAIKLYHEGTSILYSFDETPKGHQCANTSQCDGARTCSQYNWCQGTARPSKIYDDYVYNESLTGSRCPTSTSDPQYRIRDYLCDGSRVCSTYGWCTGTARLNQADTYLDLYDQLITGSRCPQNTNVTFYDYRDLYCDGARTCSPFGWCQGLARPPKDINYKYDESKTGIRCPYDNDIYVPIKDYWCDGRRTCSYWGWCQGTK